MAASRLKIYRGPDETDVVVTPDATTRTREITLSVDAVLPLLMDAATNHRTWLDDFCGDEITISSDLYEVLLAYQYFRRPSA
ncbi:hypothetical protein Mal64_15420 [Pseudobythopirellula maris]|uniref:Uncharacterized protein n=1 Tax=Pseudobythopirellula maris TaxID=2527991 RepID=A0A5C5ZXY1_9BACT|nr:hypothetical protein [Pseudobythopirellula maris]TWT91143.1 hypothetical protein Mal64_15420 [Pseudobythopirellula maris]